MRARLANEVALESLESWRWDPNVYLDNGIFALYLHSNREEADAAAATVARLRAIPGRLADAERQLEPERLVGQLLAERVIPLVLAQASFLRDGLPAFVADPEHRRRVAEAAEPAAQAYETFAAFLEASRSRSGGSFVFGEERYDTVLSVGEGLPFGARTLREIGERNMASIEAAMDECARRIDPASDRHAVLARLQDAHPESMEAMLAAYRVATAEARQFVLDRDLVTLPEGEECEVEPSPPFMRPSVPVAFYFSPPSLGRAAPGRFNVPFTADGATAEEQTDRLRSNANYSIPTISVHEAYPGHHLHFAVATRTSLLRQILTSTYLIEGWGLYSEQMVSDAGYYDDPAEQLGQLDARHFRAARIVVDTSLHLGEMTFDEAVEFMHTAPRSLSAPHAARCCATARGRPRPRAT